MTPYPSNVAPENTALCRVSILQMGEIVAASFTGSMSLKTTFLSLRWGGHPGGLQCSRNGLILYFLRSTVETVSILRTFESGSCFSKTVNQKLKKKKITGKKTQEGLRLFSRSASPGFCGSRVSSHTQRWKGVGAVGAPSGACCRRNGWIFLVVKAHSCVLTELDQGVGQNLPRQILICELACPEIRGIVGHA